mgnify:CR=1 FL=1
MPLPNKDKQIGTASTEIPRREVLGSMVDVLDMDTALGVIDEFIENDHARGYVVAINPEKVYAVRQNTFLQNFLANASLLVPDGIGLVGALRLLYGDKVHRGPGADLMQEICAKAPERGYRIFVYGGEEKVNHEAVEKLHQRHPGLQIVGRANGYVPQEKMPDLINQINDSQADILFVALGSPKQEEWIHQHISELNVKVCQGIGGTLDTIVGNVARAPNVFQRCHLEWFYRLLKQPSRIKRQAKLPLFVLQVIGAKCTMEWRRLRNNS